MKDLAHPRWIKIKGLLFLAIGIIAAALILIQEPDWTTALLDGAAFGAGDLEFLPVLLFRVLCHRKVCGPQL